MGILIVLKTFLWHGRKRATNLREKLDFSRWLARSKLVLDFCPMVDAGSLTCSRRLTEDAMFTELFGLSPWSRARPIPPSSFRSFEGCVSQILEARMHGK